MADTPVPVPAGSTFGPAIQDQQSQAVPVPAGATFGPPIQDNAASGQQPPEQTAPGSGAFNDVVQRFTSGFTQHSGVQGIADTLDSGISGMISAAKQRWADAQAGRDAESQMGKAVTDAVKQGNYGQAAEHLLKFIASNVSPAVGVARDLGQTGEAAISDVKKGNVAGAAGDVVGGAAKYAPLLVAPEAGGEAEAATEEAAADTNAATHVFDPATKKISPIQKIKQAVSPEAASQPGAQATLRGAAGAGETGGVRTLLDEPIAAVAKTERATYDTLNKASGTDLKALYDHAEEVQDALDDPTNIAQKSSLQAELKTTQDQIATGEAAATKNGVDPSVMEKAKGLTQERYAKEALKQKLFNNESIVEGDVRFQEPETINVKAAIRQAQNLDKPSRYAPEGSPTRLRQALGDKGANDLLQGLYQAQKAGSKVLTRNKVLTILGASGGAVGGVFGFLKH